MILPKGIDHNQKQLSKIHMQYMHILPVSLKGGVVLLGSKFIHKDKAS